ncbi:hypothetical protein LDENG_00049870 [Lucifuga dentata]|nr:hypothetical protein LDENG_00049870 [Lucifuga dentata]
MWFGFVLAALSAAGEVIKTKPRQRVTIKCEVQTITKELKWKRGDDMIYNLNWKSGVRLNGQGDIMKRVALKQEKNLEISSVEERDAGEFTCVADGRSHKYTLLVVSVSISPSANLQLGNEARLECQVNGLDHKSRVEWHGPDGSSTESRTVHLKRVASSHAGTWVCKFSQDGNMYEETLKLNVKEPEMPTPSPGQNSENAIKSTCHNSRAGTPNPGTHKGWGLLGLSWWMWAAVGGGFLVLILLMVCVIVLYKRNRRRRRKFLKLKKTRELLKAKTFCQCNCPAAAAPPPRGQRREKPSAAALMV